MTPGVQPFWNGHLVRLLSGRWVYIAWPNGRDAQEIWEWLYEATYGNK